MHKKSPVTAVVLNKNGAKTLGLALDSLRWCQEILVLDDHSTDTSSAITSPYGVRWIPSPLYDDFSRQRNHALELATQEWVLFADADEEISPALAAEIQKQLSQTTAQGFLIARTDLFMGRMLKHGETGSIWLLRLAKKTAGVWVRPVHEIWHIRGPIRKLHHPIVHRAHESVTSFLAKIARYAQLEATYRKNIGRPFSWIELFLYPTGKFVLNYVLKLGFLDGFPGLAMAYMMSLHSLIVRIEMYENT